MKTARFIALVFAALALATLYLLLDPRGAGSQHPERAAAPGAAADQPASAPRTLTLNIQTPAPGVPPQVQLVKVMQGELVHLRIDSALDGEVIQHEQGLRVPVEAGKPTQASFRASAAGRFPLQFLSDDGGQHPLGDLVVPPR